MFSCLAKLLFLPLMLLFLLFAVLFAGIRRGTRSNVFRQHSDEDEKATKERNSDRYQRAETVEYEEIPSSEIAEDNVPDYDPNPGNTRRVEDAEWEEITD